MMSSGVRLSEPIPKKAPIRPSQGSMANLSTVPNSNVGGASYSSSSIIWIGSFFVKSQSQAKDAYVLYAQYDKDGRFLDVVIEDFELIRKDVEDFDIFYEGKKINVTITIGISFYKKEFSLDDFLKEVDTFLYNGKEAGRNRVSYAIEVK